MTSLSRGRRRDEFLEYVYSTMTRGIVLRLTVCRFAAYQDLRLDRRNRKASKLLRLLLLQSQTPHHVRVTKNQSPQLARGLLWRIYPLGMYTPLPPFRILFISLLVIYRRLTTPDHHLPPSPSLIRSPSMDSVSSQRLTEEERIDYFKHHPNVAEVEAHRVLCRCCGKWLKLHSSQRYALSAWKSHELLCTPKYVWGFAYGVNVKFF